MCNFPFKWITYSNFSAKFITAFIWLASSNSERHPPTSIICFPRPTVIFVWKYVGSTFYRQPGLYREINFYELWVGGGWRWVGDWLIVIIFSGMLNRFPELIIIIQLQILRYGASPNRLVSNYYANSLYSHCMQLWRVVRKYPIIMKSGDIVEFRCNHVVPVC